MATTLEPYCIDEYDEHVVDNPIHVDHIQGVDKTWSAVVVHRTHAVSIHVFFTCSKIPLTSPGFWQQIHTLALSIIESSAQHAVVVRCATAQQYSRYASVLKSLTHYERTMQPICGRDGSVASRIMLQLQGIPARAMRDMRIFEWEHYPLLPPSTRDDGTKTSGITPHVWSVTHTDTVLISVVQLHIHEHPCTASQKMAAKLANPCATNLIDGYSTISLASSSSRVTLDEQQCYLWEDFVRARQDMVSEDPVVHPSWDLTRPTPFARTCGGIAWSLFITEPTLPKPKIPEVTVTPSLASRKRKRPIYSTSVAVSAKRVKCTKRHTPESHAVKKKTDTVAAPCHPSYLPLLRTRALWNAVMGYFVHREDPCADHGSPTCPEDVQWMIAFVRLLFAQHCRTRCVDENLAQWSLPDFVTTMLEINSQQWQYAVYRTLCMHTCPLEYPDLWMALLYFEDKCILHARDNYITQKLLPPHPDRFDDDHVTLWWIVCLFVDHGYIFEDLFKYPGSPFAEEEGESLELLVTDTTEAFVKKIVTKVGAVVNGIKKKTKHKHHAALTQHLHTILCQREDADSDLAIPMIID